MTLQVPYIANGIIERNAEALLAQYALARGIEIRAPVPIEDIVEKFLKLHVEFDDLHRRLGVPRQGKEADIFGAIWLDKGEIVIDESLDPEVRPVLEGRYRFTLGHEAGHWRLHRPLLEKDRNQGALFGDTRQPIVACRASQSNDRAEVQANQYSSFLLMPRNLVLQAWRDRFGSVHPCVLRRKDGTVVLSDVEKEMATAACSFDRAQDAEVLEQFARPFAREFLVSPAAMRIRLETLRLVHREVSSQWSLLLGS
jgi:Zn-dependent peptidase ImmA (M78 family)